MPKTRACGVLIENGKLLLMHRILNGDEYWVFPGGGVEEGETVEEATIREMMEETSLKVNLERLLHKFEIEGDIHIFYLCQKKEGEAALHPKSPEFLRNNPDNFYELVWIDIEELQKYRIFPLEIRDLLIQDLQNGFSIEPKTIQTTKKN